MIRDLRPTLPELKLVICVDDVDAPGVTSFARVVHDTPEIADGDRESRSALEIMRMCFN